MNKPFISYNINNKLVSITKPKIRLIRIERFDQVVELGDLGLVDKQLLVQVFEQFAERWLVLERLEDGRILTGSEKCAQVFSRVAQTERYLFL